MSAKEDAGKRTKKAASAGMIAAIYAVYFIIPDMGFISPALHNISVTCNVDPGVASYMMTLPSLFQIVAALLCGYIAGRRVNYKTLLVIGVGGVAVFGMLPAFMQPTTPFAVFLVIRAAFGFCLGFLMPVINTAIAKIFDEDGRSAALGKANIFFNVGAVFALLAGGALASVAWNGSFWLYGIALIVLVFVVIGFKEPDHDAEMAAKERGEKVRIPAVAWFFIATFAITNMCDQPVMSVLSSVFAYHQIGGSELAGLTQAFFVIAGIIVSALFSTIFKKTRRWALSLMAISVVVGQLVLFAGTNALASLPLAIIGVFLIGAGNTGVTVGTPLVTSLEVEPAAYAKAMSFSKVAMDVGAFLSSPFIQGVTAAVGTDDYSVVFIVSAVIMTVVFIAYLAVARKRNLKEVKQATELPA